MILSSTSVWWAWSFSSKLWSLRRRSCSSVKAAWSPSRSSSTRPCSCSTTHLMSWENQICEFCRASFCLSWALSLLQSVAFILLNSLLFLCPFAAKNNICTCFFFQNNLSLSPFPSSLLVLCCCVPHGWYIFLDSWTGSWEHDTSGSCSRSYLSISRSLSKSCERHQAAEWIEPLFSSPSALLPLWCWSSSPVHLDQPLQSEFLTRSYFMVDSESKCRF